MKKYTTAAMIRNVSSALMNRPIHLEQRHGAEVGPSADLADEAEQHTRDVRVREATTLVANA